MKQWEVWGRNDAPSQDASWEGWTKLMDCQSVKPSGLPVGQLSEEDRTRVAEGETFLFPKGVPEVRYIRFKVNDVWNTAEGRFLTFTELTFWEYVDFLREVMYEEYVEILRPTLIAMKKK